MERFVLYKNELIFMNEIEKVVEVIPMTFVLKITKEEIQNRIGSKISCVDMVFLNRYLNETLSDDYVNEVIFNEIIENLKEDFLYNLKLDYDVIISVESMKDLF